MEKIIFVSGDEFERFVEKCIELDEKVYEPKYMGNIDFYKEAFHKNSSSFIFAIDTETDSLAGYMFATPLKNKVYNKFSSGDYIDTEFITPDGISDTNNNINSKIYIYSLVVNPSYQGFGLSKRLVRSFEDNIANISKDFENISVLCDVINPVVYKTMHHYGFRMKNTSNHKSIIMEKVYQDRSQCIIAI